GDREEGVGGELVVPGQVGAEPAVEPAGIEAELDLAGPLRPEVRVPDVAGREGGGAAEGEGAPGPGGIEGAGRASGVPDRRAELDLAPPGLPERLVGDDVRRADLRVDLEPELLAEGAAPVDPGAGGQEDPVVEADQVVEEETAGDDPRLGAEDETD